MLLSLWKRPGWGEQQHGENFDLDFTYSAWSGGGCRVGRAGLCPPRPPVSCSALCCDL